MINPKIRAKNRIYKELPENLKKLMEQYILPEEIHMKVLEDIKQQSYEGKRPVEFPQFLIITGQTGSGKSNLTSYLYSKNDNMVIIDSDKYKSYRPDSREILTSHMEEYGFLTAPDSYLHRDEMIVDALKSKYNILMEVAPSKKEGLFIDIDFIKKLGYNVEIHLLGVSALNSILSVHERYESLLQRNSGSAKLTSIQRHDESFESLIPAIRAEQNKQGISVHVYKRGKDYPYTPIEVYNSINSNRYSCPVEALIDVQNQDLKEAIPNIENRYKIVQEQMNNRNAPQGQKEQLNEVKKRYEKIIDNTKGKDL